MGEITPFRFPWETQLPEVPKPSVEDTVVLIQRDMAYMLQFTAVKVHSSREDFQTIVNTPRGQIIPRGEIRFTDGTTVEMQDIGMPQLHVQTMDVADIVKEIWQTATELGLEIVS